MLFLVVFLGELIGFSKRNMSMLGSKSKQKLFSQLGTLDW